MIEKMFEASIPSETIKSRAYQIQKKSVEINRTNPSPTNHSENQKNTSIQRDKRGRFIKGTAPPGPGRRPKHAEDDDAGGGTSQDQAKNLAKARAYTSAIYLAEIAISQLSRIEPDDPKREKAFWGKPGQEKMC